MPDPHRPRAYRVCTRWSDSLPDSQVYATTGPPALRLITCGGTYDRQRGEYSHNLVVYATLKGADSPSPPPPRNWTWTMPLRRLPQRPPPAVRRGRHLPQHDSASRQRT
ncbi:hypothetical protein GCM10009730_59590 [Streptomyces albidochromogenes]